MPSNYLADRVHTLQNRRNWRGEVPPQFGRISAFHLFSSMSAADIFPELSEKMVKPVRSRPPTDLPMVSSFVHIRYSLIQTMMADNFSSIFMAFSIQRYVVGSIMTFLPIYRNKRQRGQLIQPLKRASARNTPSPQHL